MSTTIVKLREEHRNMATLLTLLNREVLAFSQGKSADFELVESILEYNLHFPDACHHPKEDVIYKRLCERDADAAKAVGDLASEHTELHALTMRLSSAVENVLRDRELPRDWFVEVAGEYLRFLRRHMQMEEVVFFPAAERVLTDEDWARVDAQVFNQDDPVFDNQADERYESLRQAIMQAEDDTGTTAE